VEIFLLRAKLGAIYRHGERERETLILEKNFSCHWGRALPFMDSQSCLHLPLRPFAARKLRGRGERASERGVLVRLGGAEKKNAL